MPDMLVKLYELDDDWSFINRMKDNGVLIRKPIAPEKHVITEWVAERFGRAWASETDVAISHNPMGCFIAIEEESGRLVGFSCYDSTALGIFGPIGVAESHRGRSIGTALLLACLGDMKLRGYGYAVIGSTGSMEFYSKVVGATEIPNSKPSIWRTWLKSDPT